MLKVKRTVSYYNLYIFVFGLMIFFNNIKDSYIRYILPIEQIGTLSKILVILLVVPILFKIKFRKTNIIFIFCSLIVVLISVSQSLDWNILLLASAIFAASVINYHKFLKTILLSSIMSLLVVFLFLVTNLIPNTQSFRSDGAVRYGLGFIQPVVVPNILMLILLLIGYIYIKRIGFYFVIFLLPVLGVYFLCDSRASLFRSILIIFFFLGYYYKSENIRIKDINFFFYTNIFLLIGGIIASFYFAMFYNSSNRLMATISEFMTSRPFWWNRFWNMYDSKLFGQELLRVSSASVRSGSADEMFILDNSYLSLWLENGILVFFILIILLFKLLRNFKKNQDILSLFTWVIYLSLAITATGAIRIDTNIFLLQLGLLIGNQDKIEVNSNLKVNYNIKKGELYDY